MRPNSSRGENPGEGVDPAVAEDELRLPVHGHPDGRGPVGVDHRRSRPAPGPWMSGVAWGHQAGFVGEDHELGAVTGMELGHGPVDMGFRGQ